MSAIEIYNEKVRDLLKDGTERQNLPLLDDPERGTVAEGLSEEWPRSEQHLCQLLRQIEARRTVSLLIVTVHTLTGHASYTCTGCIQQSPLYRAAVHCASCRFWASCQTCLSCLP